MKRDVNYEEAKAGGRNLPPLSLALDGRLPDTEAERRVCQEHWLQRFSDGLFGHMPPPPDDFEVTRHPLPDGNCERLVLRCEVGGRRFECDAALWLPEDRMKPAPLVTGLDFLGPVGTLSSDAFPIDPNAVVAMPHWVTERRGPLHDTFRGVSPYRWPVEKIRAKGRAVLTSCYGSWVPDHPELYRERGLWPLLDMDGRGEPGTAIGLWAWALARLIDAAAKIPEIDTGQVAVAGHSRLGKAALWASVNDARIGTLLLCQSGCGGAALSARDFGENLDYMRAAFPHWILPLERAREARLEKLDQHQLLACMAPRRLYVNAGESDHWTDPRGQYLGLKAAAPFWAIEGSQPELPEAESACRAGETVIAGPLGWHMRAGGHELLPYDWDRFLAFLDQK